MTEVIVKTEKGQVVSISAEGHSGYAPHGEDLVCAAITTLMQTLSIGLDDVLNLGDVITKVDEEKTYIGISWKYNDDARLVALAETIKESLKRIAESYSDYVRLVEVHK